jgi:hypothetical protein
MTWPCPVRAQPGGADRVCTIHGAADRRARGNNMRPSGRILRRVGVTGSPPLLSPSRTAAQTRPERGSGPSPPRVAPAAHFHAARPSTDEIANSALEPRSMGYVESPIRQQAEAAADDLLHYLGGRRRGASRQHAAVMQSVGAGLLDPSQAVRRAGRGGFPTRIPRTNRHYAAYGGTAATRASLALDKPLCR